MPFDSDTYQDNHATYQHIFLLSHMRANTSLISHILGSHNDISGYYEMHLSYVTENDLLKQEEELSNKKAGHDIITSSTKYLFDKLLHNDYELVLENLSAKKIKILVSVRPAEQTIKSIINLFRNKNNGHPYADPEQAVNYYIERIIALAKFCTKHPYKYYYYDADLIRTRPKETLARIQHWLSLKTPLTDQYRIFSLTGQAGAGDSSDNMKKGRIIQSRTDYEDIKIPSHLLQKAITETRKHKQLIVTHAIEALSCRLVSESNDVLL